MGRLIKEALYSPKDADMRGENPGPCDWTDYNARWEKAAERIRKIDPHGLKSYKLLCMVEAGL